MRLAILSAIPENWSLSRSFLLELEKALSRVPEVECSVWLINNANSLSPETRNSMNPSAFLESYLIETLVHISPQQAFASAIGYLCYVIEPDFDSILILPRIEGMKAADIVHCLQAANRNHSQIIEFTPEGKISAFPRYFFSLLTRVATGHSLQESSPLILPRAIAETLSNSPFTSCHLLAAARKISAPILRIPALNAKYFKAPQTNEHSLSCWLSNLLATISVFREAVATRAIIISLLALGFSILALVGNTLYPRASLDPFYSAPALWLCSGFFALLFFASAFFGISSFSLSTLRRWTPALDCMTAIRSVTRLKSLPYAVTAEFF